MDKKTLVLLLLKAVPCLGAICCASDSMLAYLGFNLEWLGYVMVIFFLIAWYALARYFHFCTFYFILLFYIISCEFLNTVDFLFGIPVSDKAFFVMHVALFGFYALLYTYIHVRDNKKHKNNPGELG